MNKKATPFWRSALNAAMVALLSVVISAGAFAQNKSIDVTLKVLDEAGDAVIGAAVYLKSNPQKAAMVGVDGKAEIKGVPGNGMLVVEFLGLATQEIMIDNRNTIDVVMKPNAVDLESVVVMGYGGTQNRTTMTNAVSKLDTKALQNVSLSNAASALQGNIPGLRVVNVSGKPGSAPNIVLRGGTTITGTNNGALTVIDGVVRSLNDINPADIESIQVLKDAASTAIYGARANGGVILVTTKRGKEGSASINYTFKNGWNYARKGYSFAGAQDYLYYNRLGNRYAYEDGLEGKVGGWSRTLAAVNNQNGYGATAMLGDVKYLAGNEALLQQGWKQMTDPYDGKSQLIFRDYQGQMTDAAFNNPSYTSDHYINFTGGNNKSTFMASFGYYDEQGVVKNTSYKRLTGQIAGSYKIFDNFTVNASANMSHVTAPNLWISEAQLFYRSMSMWPTWNPWREDGTPAAGVASADGNPMYWSEKLLRSNITTKQNFNGGFSWNILPELTLSANAYLYYLDNQQENFDKAYQTQNSSTPNTTRAARAYYNRQLQQQYNSTLTYAKTFNEKHNLNVMMGGEFYRFDSFVFQADANGAPTDDIPTLNASPNRTATTSTKTARAILSAFARVNYNYDQRFLLSAVIRTDGVSQLSDNRWGIFPGISGGWNIHSEEFFRSSKISDVVSMLKPRLSYGVNGNIAGLDDFEVFGTYGSVTNYNGIGSYLNTGLVNNGLRWERSVAFEAGLDMGMFNNKLTLSMDYYNRQTEDLLTNLALPGYTGFSSFRTNLGTLQNTGFEFDARYIIFNNADGFSWDVAVNFSTLANKILKLPFNGNDNNRQGGTQIYDPAQGKVVWVGGYQEGGRLGDIYGYKQVGIFSSAAELAQIAGNRYDAIGQLYGPTAWASMTTAQKAGKQPISVGDVNWADINGDGNITTLDRTYIGNYLPNFMGGFGTNLSYKSITLSARFDFAVGHTLYNDLKARSLGQYQGAFGVLEMVKDTWTPENPNATLPKFYYADQLAKKNITRSNNGGVVLDNNNSTFYERGDYLALRELTLSWAIPQVWTKAISINRANIFLTGQNLAYFTKYTGSNPEPAVATSVVGVDEGRYPIPRTVVLGLSVTF